MKKLDRRDFIKKSTLTAAQGFYESSISKPLILGG